MIKRKREGYRCRRRKKGQDKDRPIIVNAKRMLMSSRSAPHCNGGQCCIEDQGRHWYRIPPKQNKTKRNKTKQTIRPYATLTYACEKTLRDINAPYAALGTLRLLMYLE